MNKVFNHLKYYLSPKHIREQYYIDGFSGMYIKQCKVTFSKKQWEKLKNGEVISISENERYIARPVDEDLLTIEKQARKNFKPDYKYRITTYIHYA